VLVRKDNQPEALGGLVIRYGVADQWDRAPERLFVSADAQGRFEARVPAGWISLERDVSGSNQQDGDVPKLWRFITGRQMRDLGDIQLPARKEP
jgi:hypothetical protein